jgi:glycosyltransferase involved in cell wall biosynthesis
MKIVLHSPAFYPMIGGLEAFAAMLAGGLQTRGHEVVVLCESELEPGVAEPFSFRVVRGASFFEKVYWIGWSDAVVHAQISLKGLLPWLLTLRPLLVSHQTWLREAGDTPLTWPTLLKRQACRFARNVTCSAAIGRDLGLAHDVIPNPYDDALFRLRPEVPRDRDLLFVGRLVSDKGADLLLQALARMPGRRLTIVGDGPEAAALVWRAEEWKVADRVTFTGPKRGEKLARLMNAHRILVVPSRWAEPFGIVALEGAASGCTVVASDGGGLPEAVGPCGGVFASGDAASLAQALENVPPPVPAAVAAHLARHRAGAVVAAYEEMLLALTRGNAQSV